MKQKSMLLAVMGVLMIFSGSVMSFVASFAKDVSDTRNGMEEIQEKYNSFKGLMEEFNQKREIVYTDVINDLYIENVAGKYGFWNTTFREYEQVVEKVKAYESTIKDSCVGVLYNDNTVQSKCDSMVISYETAMNYYVKDVNKYNDFIALYNESLDPSYQISQFDKKDYDYIDFNDDGNYMGQ